MYQQILLMTRPRAVSLRFVARLDPLLLEGVNVLISPLIEIEQIGETPALGSHSGAIFTSANGVEFAPDGQGQPAFCVGERTAAHAAARGWDVKTVQQDADRLVQEIAAADVQGPLVHFSGKHRRGDIAQRLIAQGVRVDVHELYDQPLWPLSQDAKAAFAGEVPVILPLFSPRTAAHLGTQHCSARSTQMVAMSSAVAQAAQGIEFGNVEIITEPTGHEMALCIEKLLRRNRLP